MNIEEESREEKGVLILGMGGYEHVHGFSIGD